MGKMPASLFYWGDFVRDPNLRRCTHAEVGAWMRILCLMFEAEIKGVLSTNGIPWTDEEIVMAIGGKYEETLNIVTSLVTKGVASRNGDGAIFNRRMYREEKERIDSTERVRRHREKLKRNEECNGDSNANDMPCTVSEYETEDETSTSFVSKTRQMHCDKDAIYAAYPRKVGRAAAMKSIQKAFDRLTSSVGEGDFKFVPEEANSFLIGMAETFAQSPAGCAGEYTPHPGTWFNQSRYLDDPNEWQRGGSHGNTSSNGKSHKTDGNDAAIQRFMESTNDPRTIDSCSIGNTGADAGQRPQQAGDNPVLRGRADAGEPSTVHPSVQPSAGDVPVLPQPGRTARLCFPA